MNIEDCARYQKYYNTDQMKEGMCVVGYFDFVCEPAGETGTLPCTGLLASQLT